MQDPRITFFPKRRVRLELTDWAPKRNAQGEKRVRLDFTLPIIDAAGEGEQPGWMLPALNAMESKESVTGKTKLEVELDGVTIELFDHDKAPSVAKLLASATITDFYLQRITRDGQTYPALTFCTNVARTGMLSFCDRYEECWMWAAFTPVSADAKTPPVPGVQMSIADAKSAAAGDTQDEGSALKNAESFFRGKGGKQEKDDMPHQDPKAAAAVASIGTGRGKGGSKKPN